MAAPATETGTRVYVHNLPWELTEDELSGHMSSAGTVSSITIMRHPDGRSKGCAIVTFASPYDASNAISTLAETELHGRKMLVREDREGADGPKRGEGAPSRGGAARGGARGGAGGAARGGRGGHHRSPRAEGEEHAAAPARSPASRVPGTSVHVSNLAWRVGWQELKDAFAEYHATYADVKYQPDGRSKGWGIVRFESPDDAARALKEMNGFDLQGRQLYLKEDNGPTPSTHAA